MIDQSERKQTDRQAGRFVCKWMDGCTERETEGETNRQTNINARLAYIWHTYQYTSVHANTYVRTKYTYITYIKTLMHVCMHADMKAGSIPPLPNTYTRIMQARTPAQIYFDLGTFLKNSPVVIVQSTLLGSFTQGR